MTKFTVGSLFSGIGGIDLGFERAGFETAWQVEINDYCRKVLAKHFPAAERYADVRECGAANLKRVDVIVGGFPCQDISNAGLRAGITGERSGLWSEYARIIGELRPRFVLVENVAALLGRGMGTVLGDLAALGYDAEWDVISAADMGAPHLRERIWILAYPMRCLGSAEPGQQQGQWASFADAGCAGDVADAASSRLTEGLSPEGGSVRYEARRSQPKRRGIEVADTDVSGSARYGEHGRQVSEAEGGLRLGSSQRGGGYSEWWAIEPEVGRVAHGVPRRVDRLRALGNAVVPQIPEMIARRIMQALISQ